MIRSKRGGALPNKNRVPIRRDIDALAGKPSTIGLRRRTTLIVNAAQCENAAVAAFHHAIRPDDRRPAVGFRRIAKTRRIEVGRDVTDLRLTCCTVALAGLQRWVVTRILRCPEAIGLYNYGRNIDRHTISSGNPMRRNTWNRVAKGNLRPYIISGGPHGKVIRSIR